MIPIIDFVIPEKFNVHIGENNVPLSTWFQAMKRGKKTHTRAFYPISRCYSRGHELYYNISILKVEFFFFFQLRESDVDNNEFD